MEQNEQLRSPLVWRLTSSNNQVMPIDKVTLNNNDIIDSDCRCKARCRVGAYMMQQAILFFAKIPPIY
jgi:hypothetical protein